MFLSQTYTTPITPTNHRSQAKHMFSSQIYNRGVRFVAIKPTNRRT